MGKEEQRNGAVSRGGSGNFKKAFKDGRNNVFVHNWELSGRKGETAKTGDKGEDAGAVSLSRGAGRDSSYD